MSWSGRRKGLYVGTTLLIVILISGAVAYVFLNRPATCLDGARNGNEKGIDCGGSCARICEGDAQAPVVLWTRALRVAPGIYTAAAYIENRNNDAFARHVRYTFRLFDDRNVLIAERVGVTAIAPTRFVPVIEANISTGNRVPTRAFFEFADTPMWERGSLPRLELSNQVLDEENRKVSLHVRNDSGKAVSGIPIATILYDANGTAQAASVSSIKRLEKGATEQVVFTWPSAFSVPIIEAQVIALPTP